MQKQVIIISVVVIIVYGAALYGYVLMGGALIPPGISDSAEYPDLAKNILESGKFVKSARPSVPETFRVPGYPLILAGAYSLFHNYFAVVYLQILMVWATAMLLLFSSRKLIQRPALHLVAPLLYILDPTTILHAIIVMSDVTNVLLLVAVVYLLFFSERTTITVYAVAGMLLGISVLVRTLGIYLWTLLLPASFYKQHIKEKLVDLRKIAILLTVFLLGFVLVLTPWILRNKILTKTWGISQSAYSLWYGIGDMYHEENPNFDALSLLREAGINSETEAKDLINSSSLMSVNMRHIMTRPLKYAYYHVSKLPHFFFASGLSEIFSRNNFSWKYTDKLPGRAVFMSIGTSLLKFKVALPLLFMLERCAWLAIFALCVIAAMFRENRQMTIILWLLIGYVALLTGPVSFTTRYRLPAEPFMFLLAVIGLNHIINLFLLKRAQKRKSMMPITIV